MVGHRPILAGDATKLCKFGVAVLVSVQYYFQRKESYSYQKINADINQEHSHRIQKMKSSGLIWKCSYLSRLLKGGRSEAGLRWFGAPEAEVVKLFSSRETTFRILLIEKNRFSNTHLSTKEVKIKTDISYESYISQNLRDAGAGLCWL